MFARFLILALGLMCCAPSWAQAPVAACVATSNCAGDPGFNGIHVTGTGSTGEIGGMTAGGVPLSTVATQAGASAAATALSAETARAEAAEAAAQSTANAALPKAGGTMTGTIVNGTLSGTGVTAATAYPTGGSTLRTVGAIAGDVINPKSFGAIGDGSSHTVASTLGISTAAGLIAYTSNGTTPYSWINTEPFGVRFNLQIASAASNGTTSLSFAGTGTIATQIASTSAIASTNTTVTVADLAVTADGTAVASGTPVSASCLQAGTTVSGAPTGSLGSYTVTFTPAATGACSSGTLLTFGVSPASGVYVLPIKYTSGIRQGDLITGLTCIPTGTQVEYVNPSKSEIRLSLGTTGICAGNSTLTFIPSWLSNVTTGMSVRGLSGVFPSNETVSAVNTTTGVVTLSVATTGAITPTTAVLGVGSPTVQTTQVTFWRPYTDAEVAALQLDRLGWQAAINALSATTGGQVTATAGQYQIDAALILPISATSVTSPRVQNSIGGLPGSSVSSTVLQVTKDLGPNQAALSCGDPAATLQNHFGIYQGVGYYCSGEMHDIVLNGQYGFNFTFGFRPKWSGVPIAMDGLKQGARLNMRNVLIQGFNAGIRNVGDHTNWDFVNSLNNYVGLYMDDSEILLVGDDHMTNTYFTGSGFAGIMISPRASLNVQMDKGYLGYNPYGIYCEAGPSVNTCLIDSTFTNLNMEADDCGAIKDGSLADGLLPALGSNKLYNLTFKTSFFGVGVNGSNVPNDNTTLPGGCSYNATIDAWGTLGIDISGIYFGSFVPVAGEASIIRGTLMDSNFAVNIGGGSLSGVALMSLMQTFGALDISMVTGTGAWGQDAIFYDTGILNWILSGPGWRGRPLPMVSNSATSYTLGQVVEYTLGSGGVDGSTAVQLAGTSANAPVAGVICSAAANSPYSKNFVPVICTGGTAIPVLTSTTQGVGTMVKVGTSTVGTAVSATGMTDTGNGSGPIGIIMRSPSGTAAVMKALFPGAE